MANRTPYFFLAPTWDYPSSSSGPIQLGNIITSVKTPERALYRAPMPDDSTVFSTAQSQVEFSIEKLFGGKLGIFTKLLNAILGFGVDAAVNWEVNDTSHFIFESLETTQFSPEPGYIHSCVSAEPVRRYLEKSRYRKPVYIITGLKTARGATARSLKARTVDGDISVGADATSWTGVPVEGGIEIGSKIGGKEHVSWKGTSDFVFAFRVRKLVVERKTGLVSKEADYKKGAMLESVIEKRSESELSITEQAVEMDDDVAGFFDEELPGDDELVLRAVPNIQRGQTDIGS
ncbi:hypothetical protein F5Y12DRAFT_180742 [Xylaria sp. FL1777]|nr:hypothetical protein F5Y12DRAFT_180742 [Xylaria sp. FL1777]